MAILALVIVGLTIRFWYVAVSLICVAAAILAIRRWRRARADRHRAGPADPWLNEINVALAELGFRERRRNRPGATGGVPSAGSIELRARFLDVRIVLLANAATAHRAEIGLRTDERLRKRLRDGSRMLLTREDMLFLAAGRPKVVDEALLDEVVRVVEHLPTGLCGRQGAWVTSAGGRAT